MREVMEVEITWKTKKVWPIKSGEECIKKDLEQYGLRREKKTGTTERNDERELERKLLTLVSRDNGIKKYIYYIYANKLRAAADAFCP